MWNYIYIFTIFLIYRVPKVIFHPVSKFFLTFQNRLQF